MTARDAEIVELKAKLQSVTADRVDRLRAASLSQINSAGAVNSTQLYQLLSVIEPRGRQTSGAKRGVEQPLADYLANLKHQLNGSTISVHLERRAWGVLLGAVLHLAATIPTATAT